MDEIRVLHLMNGAISGGISMTVLNMYKSINNENIHFDCAVYDDNLGTNGKILQSMGCEFYKLPLKSKHPLSFAIELRHIIKRGRYDVIHVHYNDTSFFPLLIGRLYGVKKLIAHAHTYRETTNMYDKLKLHFRQKLTKIISTKCIACSKDAAISIFGKNKNVVILKNAIDTNIFKYDTNEREKIRKELNINGNLVIGCVGNLGKEKNINFAIEILSDVLKIKDNVKLLLIGDGTERENLMKLAKDKGIYESVYFLGRRADVNRILQGLDVFIMPSEYEGFGIAALEAATSGLPVILSDKIPNDFNFYPRVKYLSLNNREDWTKCIIQSISNFDRNIAKDIVCEAGFDLHTNSDKIKKIYGLEV